MSQSATLRKKNKSHNYVPWVVFFVTILSAVIAWFVTFDLGVRSDENRFKSSQQVFLAIIKDHLNHQTRLGDSAAAFMGSLKGATKKDFDDFLARQNWPESSPEIGVISYLKHVPPHGGREFLEYARSHGVTGASVDFGRDGLDRALVLYRRPYEVGMTPPGYETTGIESRRVAIVASRDLGEAVSTDPLYLIQDKTHKSPAVVIFIPVYTEAAKLKTRDERRKSIQGYVGVVIRMSVAVNGLLDREQFPYLTVKCLSSASPNNVLFTDFPANHRSRFQDRQDVKLFNRDWEFDYRSSPSLEKDSGGNLSALILGGGLVFALILFFLTNNQVRTQKELAGYAEEIERLASAESLLAQAGTLFSTTDDYKVVLEHIGRSAVPMLADLCSVDVMEDGEIKEVVLYSLDAAEIDAARKMSDAAPLSLGDNFGIAKALRTGKSELIAGISRELAVEFNLPPIVADYIEKRGFTSAMFVPVKVRGYVLAVMTFITGPNKRPFSSSDLRQMEEVAERIGLAIDNSRLYLAAQQELEEKVKAEEALRTLNDELEQLVGYRTRELTVAVDELEAFCYSVSHDLRAPLRSVDGFSKALLEDYQGQLDADGVDYLTRIRRAAHRMDELITAMLTLSRLTRADITVVKVDVTELVREIVHENVDSGKCEIVIQKDMEAFADANMLRILFENLVANAIKFSSKVEFPQVQIGRDGDVFFVKDNGAGFDPRYSGKLFQPFERLHTPSEFPGSGIGLATVSRVVKRHAGKIWAESALGQGATFYFSLGAQQELITISTEDSSLAR